MKTLSLSEDQIKLLADALWMRQRCFIAGDKRFKEYGTMLEELLEGMDYTYLKDFDDYYRNTI
jgi:hypothetical protein